MNHREENAESQAGPTGRRSTGGAGVLLIVPEWDGQGGLQRRLRRMARALSVHGRVTVLTWASGPPATSIPGVAEVRVPSLVSWGREHRPAIARANTAVSITTALAAAVRRRSEFEVVYAASPAPEGLVAAALHRALGSPYVVGTWLPGPLGSVARLEHSPVAALLKMALDGASAYVANTNQVAAELTAAGFDSDRVVVVREGVDVEALAPSAERRARARATLGLSSDRYLLCLARFDLRQKRHDLLLHAWAAVRPEGWRLVMAGDGPDRAKVERMARELSIQPLFPGWQEPGPWLAAADANALPTNFETTGAALVEGMAAGLPGLASATAGYLELSPPGVLLLANEPGAWEQALRRLTSDGALRDRLGRAARFYAVRAFDSRRANSEMAALLGVDK